MEIDKKADQRQTRSLTAAANSQITRSSSSITTSSSLDSNQAKRKTRTDASSESLVSSKPDTSASKPATSKSKTITNIDTLKIPNSAQTNSILPTSKSTRNSLVKNHNSNISYSTSSLLTAGNCKG